MFFSFAPPLISAILSVQQIPVAYSDRPLWSPGKEWRIADRPIISIGTFEGKPEYELSRISGIVRLTDGTIVVANQGHELRFFDRTGSHVRSVGRRGDGPGEFFFIQGLTALREGTIAVNDLRHGLQVYSAEGRFIKRVALPATFGIAPQVIFDDASMVIGDWPEGKMGASYTDSIALLRLTLTGEQQALGTFPAVRYVAHPRGPNRMHFGPVLSQASRGQTWYVGYPDKWEVRVHSASGALQRVIRRTWQPTAITATDRQEYKEMLINAPGEGNQPVSAALRARRESMFTDEAFAATLPAYIRLLADPVGNLWAQDPIRPRDLLAGSSTVDVSSKRMAWSVFDASGKWLGTVQSPERFRIFEIGRDYVLGLWRDDFDVEHVRLHALIKP